MTERAGWVRRHVSPFRHGARLLFGLLWGIDGALKLLPNTVFWFQERMIAVGIGQPPWLDGWFSFWLAQANAYGTLDVALIASLEFALSASLILGLLRKTAYVGGVALSLVLWAIPEGFGGPYDQGTFDIGGGIIYAVVFLLLIVLESDPRSNWHTLDARIEGRWPGWTRWAEVEAPSPRANPTSADREAHEESLPAPATRSKGETGA